MKCPLCHLPLSQTRYEDVNVKTCSQCGGHLVRIVKLKSIENRRQKSKDDLIQELVESGVDTQQPVRCPRCHIKMEKLERKISSSKFAVDQCGSCQLVWLDSGELAKLQVLHEYSAKGHEQQAFRERLNNMTPAERKALDDRIANLPDHIPAECSAYAPDWFFMDIGDMFED